MTSINNIMRSNIDEYRSVEKAAEKFVKSVAIGEY